MTAWIASEVLLPGNPHLTAMGKEGGVEEEELVNEGNVELVAGVVADVRPARESHTDWEQWNKEVAGSEVCGAVIADQGENTLSWDGRRHEDLFVQELKRKTKKISVAKAMKSYSVEVNCRRRFIEVHE